MDSVYRERAHLVAHLAALYPSVIGYNDPNEPDWAVVFVKTPEGQLSWHVAPDDMDLFTHVAFGNLISRQVVTWDGHTTEEKYARLDRLTAAKAQGA
jgi:FtsP/CotA-like multicopper oxidase with cupredoxin domain